MSTKNVIALENVSKKYQLGLTGFSGFKNKATHNSKESNKKRKDDFWALKNVSFNVHEGEVLGIIGKNGAGKSTLLKLISRITTPTSGKIKIKGRVASLLEVGTGFHPELTGFENIYLNGTILGMTKSEINKHIDEIIDFAGITHHIYSPVKRYSSGMKVRLGFAVAAYLSPEILIVDEVLAVGDAEFQARCLGKMKEVTQEGRTVLFVSHNMSAVRKLCTSAILFKEGQIATIGDTENVIDAYVAPTGNENLSGQISWDNTNAPGCEEVSLLSVATLNSDDTVKDTFLTHERIKIKVKYQLRKKIVNSRIVITIKDSHESIVFASTSQSSDLYEKEPGIYETTCIIPGNLLNQEKYKIFFRLGHIPTQKLLIDEFHALSFNTILTSNNGATSFEKWPGTVAPLLEWNTVKTKNK